MWLLFSCCTSVFGPWIPPVPPPASQRGQGVLSGQVHLPTWSYPRRLADVLEVELLEEGAHGVDDAREHHHALARLEREDLVALRRLHARVQLLQHLVALGHAVERDLVRLVRVRVRLRLGLGLAVERDLVRLLMVSGASYVAGTQWVSTRGMVSGCVGLRKHARGVRIMPVPCASCTHHAPRTMRHAPCATHHAPCTMHHAPCTMHHAAYATRHVRARACLSTQPWYGSRCAS